MGISNQIKCDCGHVIKYDETDVTSHRLMCGDSTLVDDVEELMNGDKADMVFTDPPYNVAYEGYTKDNLTIQNDAMSDESFVQFLTEVFANYFIVCGDAAGVYVCHPSKYQREFQDVMETAGFEIRCQIIWAKNTFAWGFGRYKFQHEPIFYAHINGQSDTWYGDKSQSTLWEVNKPSANKIHPTMKPTELITKALTNSTKTGDLVVDLFGGSGSTLIACHTSGRRANLMELDAKYCDVIVERFVRLAGAVGIRLNGNPYVWSSMDGPVGS